MRKWLAWSGKTAAELADVIGVDPSTVSGWLTGRSHPRMKTLPFVYEAIGVTEERFFGALPSDEARA